ncbi:MAG: metallophosphoesterase family protein, partial [Smithellaceae bacterium]|nr:metallophosphoesterase family protein [Smithellaceae bacterium]
EGCEKLIHLGDFCDTNRRGQLEDIVSLFAEKGVQTVKGNNDYLIELSAAHSVKTGDLSQGPLYRFLKDVPMKIEFEDVCFAHSFPFDYLRAFYEPIDVGSAERAAFLFQQMPYRILFCGHSHMPVYFRLSIPDGVLRKLTAPGEHLLVEKASRYIFVVGSADEGECAVFDLQSSIYERIRIC